MCSLVSTALTLNSGVVVFVVDFNGNCLFKPQSPRARPDGVVMIACCIGYCRVAVSETLFDWTWPRRSFIGRGRGGGSEKRREPRRRLAVGESFLLDMLMT